ncbi:MAG: hypothetical protein K0R63_120 [Rickettsiales bacterium]|jgi:plastocyanin|nr:hypothetical protein [Rickettsiales bacterium]
MKTFALSTVFAASLLGFTASAQAATPAAGEELEFTVIIKDHKFNPEVLEVPAGKKITLTIDNQDATPEEFESHDLNQEKIIPGKSKGIVKLGPLDPKEYSFFGEFNEKTAKGKIVAK